MRWIAFASCPSVFGVPSRFLITYPALIEFNARRAAIRIRVIGIVLLVRPFGVPSTP
jgi:hypothetical protein